MSKRRVVKVDGKFCPQYKGWCFWHFYVFRYAIGPHFGDYQRVAFNTIEEAISFFDQREVARPIVVWTEG